MEPFVDVKLLIVMINVIISLLHILIDFDYFSVDDWYVLSKLTE